MRQISLILVLALALLIAACSEAPAPGAAEPAAVTATPGSAETQATSTTVVGAAVTSATAEPASPTAPPATATPTPPQEPAITPVPPVSGSEILFLRAGTLMAYDVATTAERSIATDVHSFAATPDGRRLALVRGTGAAAEVWLVGRDGANPQQVTSNNLAEDYLSWAPDGMTLVYTAAADELPRSHDWQEWAVWCLSAEVRLLDITTTNETTLAEGCAAAFAPDGRRIAYVTPPTTSTLDGGADSSNTLRLVNRQGANGWNFAAADGSDDMGSLLVYGPAWSPDAEQLAYHRFLGYRALVDLSLIEMGGSFTGDGTLLGSGAGWVEPAQFSPDGSRLLVSEYNYSDARGFTGYDAWLTQVLDLGVTSQMALPMGEVTADASVKGDLPRAAQAVWAPDSSEVAVLLPSGWQPDASRDQPLFSFEGTGEIWRWRPGNVPGERLIMDVDYASPLLWLPASPQYAVGMTNYRMAYPAGWDLVPAGDSADLNAVAPDGPQLMAAQPIPADAGRGVTDIFGMLIAEAETSDPITWPDGSVYTGFSGTTPDGQDVAGALRVVTGPNQVTVGLLYLTSAANWPLERAQAQALLAAGG